MSKLALIKAVVETLRYDTGIGGLVKLSEHTASDLRIAREKPPVKGRLPFLGVSIPVSVPLMQSDVTQLQRITLEFSCHAASELVVEQLADRLEVLLHKNEDSKVNTSYYNFSTDDVSTRMTRYTDRNGPDFDATTKIWTSIVRASVIWTGSPCPVSKGDD